MRVTVEAPESRTDLDVDEGVTVAFLRGRLAALTGDERWSRAHLTADGEPLHDDHPAGRRPLGHGATLRPGPGPVPDAVAAVHAGRHLAVVAGLDAGALLVPAGPATLGPGGDLDVDDGGRWSVHVRPGRSGRLLLRGAGGRAALVRPGRRRTRVLRRWRWTRWQADEELRAGTSVLALRTGCGASAQGAAAPARSGNGRWRGTARFLPSVASAATAAALAVSMHQPILLLGALSALVLVGPRPAVPTVEPPVRTAEALDLAALRVRLVADDAPAPATLPTPVPWDGDLAIAGPREQALRLARGLLLASLVGGSAPVAVRTDHPADWAWLAWFERPPAGPDESSALVVLDGPAAARWHAGDRVLRLVGDDAPAWCSRTLEAGSTGVWLQDARGRRAVPSIGVSAVVAEAVARAAGRPRTPPSSDCATMDLDGCPPDVALGFLPGIASPDRHAVARAWAASRGPTATPALIAPLGAGPGGAPVAVDLVADGPHALVAGTTGSGKSELLATLVLGLALTHPPDRLAIVLVDFKGGTGLPASLARLPHVAGHLSDLDGAGARRTLRGLFAELRRRERVLAVHGATDLRQLDACDPGTPPRLVVVIDEFRALADDLPDLLPGLGRLAAQGRSLGVHLVLATQRPSGAVPADLRANIGLRVALRVSDAADSVDLVGVGDAARIGRPGLAVVARGAGRAEPVQVARAVPRSSRPVRLARSWGAASGWAPAVPPPGSSVPEGPSAAAWVDAIRSAGGAHALRPWLPPLPAVVRAGDVPAGPGLPLALADLPDDLARGAVRWDPEAGHLLVTGGPGSGRSSTLAAIAAAALAEGRAVHCVGLPPGLLPDHPRLASRLATDDVTRVARLVRLLSRPAPRPAPGGRPRPLLVLDDAPGTLAALSTLAHGAAADLLTEQWSSAGGPVAVAAGGGSDAAAARLAPCFADRLVLGSPDPAGDALHGVPAHLAGPRPAPGRAVHLGRGDPVLCQVALPGEPGRDAAVDGDPPGDPSPPGAGVRPLPARAHRPRRDALDDSGTVVSIGLGGDDAGVVSVDLDRPLLVAGPPGSGRTATVAALASGAARAGLPVVRLDGRRLESGCPPDDGLLPDDPGAVLVADDLEDLEARHSLLTEAIAARLASGTPLRLVAATTTAHAVSAYHGLVPVLVRARRVLVLDPAEPGSLDLLGSEGAWLTDPRHRPPGRGALRLGREVVPLQVWAPDERSGL